MADRWKAFLRTLLGTAAGLGLALYAFVLVLDPYQNVPFSPPLPRAPVAGNQRFAYPALARSARFDSAILGTSTSRLLKPARLDRLLDARFVNLAMNSATAWEQDAIGRLFLRHHPHARFLVIGIDVSWCASPSQYRRLTFRPFPPWMYDDNPWNDLLYLFNDKALENAVRELEYLIGAREPKYGVDGYRNFLPPAERYDLARARQKIYGAAGAPARAMPLDPVLPHLSDPPLAFPALPMLSRLLAAAPAATVKALVFVPYHVHNLRGEAAARYAACKAEVAAIAAGVPNTHVVDFMFPSRITTDDRNYWDALHYTDATAARVERVLAQALVARRGEPGIARYLAAHALAAGSPGR